MRPVEIAICFLMLTMVFVADGDPVASVLALGFALLVIDRRSDRR